MKLLSERFKDGRKQFLQIHFKSSLYSLRFYRDFNSVNSLTEFLKSEGYINKRQDYEFYYSA